jgi:outer membrane receptor for ferric coprogen and ferric-rhodotorulic acid
MKNIDAIFADTTFFSSIVPGINESREELDKGDFIIDARVKYRITKQLEASIICNNLTNTLYQSRPANMMPPRMISLKLGLKI